MESPVATAKPARRGGCAVSSVSLNHRHDAPPAFAEATAARQGRGYNFKRLLQAAIICILACRKNESQSPVDSFCQFHRRDRRIAPKSYRRPSPESDIMEITPQGVRTR